MKTEMETETRSTPKENEGNVTDDKYEDDEDDESSLLSSSTTDDDVTSEDIEDDDEEQQGSNADETNMMVNEDDTDRHGNTVIKIDIPGPVRMKLGAHKSIRTKLKATAEKIIPILLKNKLVRHPTSKFSTDIQSIGIPNLTTVIYAIEDEATVTPDWNEDDGDADGVTAAARTDSDYLDFDDVDYDEEEDEDVGIALEKIGMTRNYNQRALSDPKRYNRGKVILSAGMIQEKADEKLNLILNEFIDGIIEDEAVPAPVRRFLIIYRDRGADDLGLRRQFYCQLLEIALQYEYNQASPAEAFSFDEDEYKCRVDNVDMIVTKMESLFSKYKGKNIRFLSNWNTGANAEQFSSQICMTEYAADGSPWKDTLPEAVFPNAKTREETYSEEFEDDALTKGRETFHEEVKNNKINKGILCTTHQKQLFKGKDGLHRELVEWGYHPTCYIMEEDLIIYVDEDEESMIPVYAPLGVGIDARETTDLLKSIRRLQLGEVLHRFVLFLNNKEHTVGQANAIDAGFVLESCIRFNHQGKRQACAITRDAITPEEAYPCIKNGLAKSKGKDVAPQAKKRRRQRQQQQQHQQQQLSSNNKTNNDNDVDDDDDSNIDEDDDEYNPCRIDRYSVLRASNHLSHSNQSKLITTLLEIFDAFRINEDTNQPTSSDVRAWRRKRFFGLLRPGSKLKHRVEEFWKSIRANTGNTKSHPKKYGGLAPNDVILRNVCLEGKKFWIRFATPETPEDCAIGPPDDGNDVVYSNRYVLEGLRSALGKDKTKKNKNIKRQWRPDTRHRVVQISKVYSFPHHDGRPPVFFGEESIKKKTPEGSTNGSTWSLCVVQDAMVDRKYEKLVSENRVLQLENNSLKSNLKSVEINSLKSSLKSHKSKNEAPKLEIISLKSKAATLERQNKSIRNANNSDEDDDDDDGEMDGNVDGDDNIVLSEYEKLRLAKMKRNHERLVALGFAQGTGVFGGSSQKNKKKKKKKKKKKTAEPIVRSRSTIPRTSKKRIDYAEFAQGTGVFGGSSQENKKKEKKKKTAEPIVRSRSTIPRTSKKRIDHAEGPKFDDTAGVWGPTGAVQNVGAEISYGNDGDDNDNNNNDVSSDLPSDASDAACSSNFITTDKIWEKTFQPGSTRINNELIVCAVFKTILQSAEKIYIYRMVGENAINRIDRYLNCICTDLKDKIAGENEAKSEKFRGNAICNIRKKFTEDDQEYLKTYMLSVTREKFAKLTEVVSKLLRCHFQQHINLVSIIESKHVVERLVKNAFKVGCEECDIDNIDDSFIDQPLKQFARHLWKIHGAN